MSKKQQVTIIVPRLYTASSSELITLGVSAEHLDPTGKTGLRPILAVPNEARFNAMKYRTPSTFAVDKRNAANINPITKATDATIDPKTDTDMSTRITRVPYHVIEWIQQDVALGVCYKADDFIADNPDSPYVSRIQILTADYIYKFYLDGSNKLLSSVSTEPAVSAKNPIFNHGIDIPLTIHPKGAGAGRFPKI